jgi:hypothetical protein
MISGCSSGTRSSSACPPSGAQKADVGQVGDESWHVLADPGGNEFCLLRRTVKPSPPLSRSSAD